VVIRNGRRASLQEASAGLEPLFAFTAGRLWDGAKNLASLDRAAAGLQFSVLAAGPLQGPNGAAIALPNIRTVGPLSAEAIGGYLAAKPIFVSLARYEPFGLAVLEAAQAGCALVLSDIPSFRELWDGAAQFVPAGDDVAAAAAIREAAHDPSLRKWLGAAAAERAKVYTVEAMATGTLALYRKLLGGERLSQEAAA
jgi:glycosyltransferase involved in cell wall biosynthesis